MNFYSIKYVSALIVGLLFMHVIAGNDCIIRTIEESQVEKRAHDIESMIKRHYYIHASMIAGTVVVDLMQIYQLGKAIFGKSSESDTSDSGSTEPGKDIVSEEAQCNILVQLAKDIGSGFKSIFFTRKGLSILLRAFGEVSAMVIMQKLVSHYWHPDTLHWFVYARVPYQRTVRLIDEFIDELQNPMLQVEQHEFYHQSLVNGCNQLVEYSERVCAYMEYKSNRLLVITQTTIGLSIGRHLFNRTNDWVAEIRTLFEDDKPNYLKISKNITTFVSELTRQLDHFASIEGETHEERRRVKYAN